jgi:peptide/nickel transport system permease protein
VERAARRRPWRSLWDSDLAWSFRHSPVAIVSAIVFVLLLGGAVLAPWVARTTPSTCAR